MNLNELSLNINVDKIKSVFSYNLTSNEDELKALAKRLNIPSVKKFRANMTMTPDDCVHRLSGDINANVSLICSRTAEPFDFEVNTNFECILSTQDIENSEVDVEVYEESVDIADVAIQYLSIALPDYPLHPNVSGEKESDLVYSDEGEVVKNESHENFKNTLAQLKKKHTP